MVFLYLFRLGKGEQQIAVIFVLLLTQGNFTGQAFANGMGEGIEFVENGDNAGLFGKRFFRIIWVWDWYSDFSIPLINNRLTIDIESYFTAITALVN
jgi:hypothetical protein